MDEWKKSERFCMYGEGVRNTRLPQARQRLAHLAYQINDCVHFLAGHAPG